ncbi:MAG: hypothetical protein ABJA98_26415 [Acidobacteriota bacterium]
MRADNRAAVLLLATIGVAFGARASAHRLDEFLQAARIGVERDRVQLEMDLTPGIVVADGVIREIDVDRNGVLSQDEQRDYADRVLSALTLRIDDSPLPRMQTAASSFPDVAALHTGDATITIRAEADVARLARGPHRLFFHNANAADSSVYLANALVSEDLDVAVTEQQRAGDQSELTIGFVVRETSARRRWAWIGLGCVGLLTVSLTRRTRRNR